MTSSCPDSFYLDGPGAATCAVLALQDVFLLEVAFVFLESSLTGASFGSMSAISKHVVSSFTHKIWKKNNNVPDIEQRPI